MKGNKDDEKEKIYRRYREVLGKPELTEDELFKIHSFFMEAGRLLCELYLDRIRLDKKKKKSK